MDRNTLRKYITLTYLYFISPPDSPTDWYDKFEAEVECASSFSSNIILIGDLNIDFLKPLPQIWQNIFESFGLCQIIKEPTRISNRSATLIDHIYVSRHDFVHSSKVVKITMSDHLGTALCWKSNSCKISDGKHKCIQYRKYRSADGTAAAAPSPSWLSLGNMLTSINSVDEKLISLNNHLLTIVKSNSKLVTRRVRKLVQPRWFNERISSAIKLRDEYKSTCNMPLYRKQRNKVVNLIKQEKTDYYRSVLISAKGNTRKLWSALKEAVGKTSVAINPTLKVNDTVIKDALHIANAFNSYFTNIASKVTVHLPNDHIYTPSPTFIDFLTAKIGSKPKFCIPYISPQYVYDYMKQIDIRKSVGLDDISGHLIQLAGTSLVLPICDILNTSIAAGTFPYLWKSAKVFALHKGGSTSDLNNFRPISVLSIISKILERHVHNCFYTYLNINELLCKSQFGFKKDNSCFTCLVSMINEWLFNINENKIVGCITLDFRKAFDVLSHEILIKKLSLYGCDDLTLLWFKSYLQDRIQHVFYNNVLSDVGYIKQGVPQGSILGPLLFILFINDLTFHINESSIYKYADDTTICAYDENIISVERKLSNDLKSVDAWCINNRLVINCAKSKCMIICTPQKRSHLTTDKLNVSVNGIALQNVNEQKVLGLHIDNSLSWRVHVNNLCNELSKLTGMLWRNRQILPFSSRLLFYNSYILSKIDYCLPIWGNSAKNGLDKIWRLQKRAVRIVCNVPYDTPSSDLFKQLKSMNIYERYFYQVSLNVYKILSLEDSPLKCLVNLQSPSRFYSLRSSSSQFTLNVPFPRKEVFKQSFSYSSAILWNSLPLDIRTSLSLNNFKRLCKNYVLSSDFSH